MCDLLQYASSFPNISFIHSTYILCFWQILHTPNIAFEIRQLALNPNAKFLAVAGDYQVAIVVLPRASSTRLASTLIDCKYVC